MGVRVPWLQHAARSNRTFMELKWAKDAADLFASSCSNRTFMELKCETYNVYRRESAVLIVPLWN